jgi:outer membrane lipoprotein-sorting protein
MKHLIAIPVLLLVSLGCVVGQDNQKEVDQIVEQFKKATEKLNSLKAYLEGLKVCEKMEIREQSKGKLEMKRPKKLRLDYTEPVKELRIVNGDLAWIYEPELNQVQKIDLRNRGAEVRGATPLEMAFSGNVDDLRRDYNIQIVAKVWVQLIELEDEVETDALDSRLSDHDHEWDDESPAKCGDCGHSTNFIAFDTQD